MTLAIFGGTGRTGQHLITKAFTAGYSLAVLARNPDKLSLPAPEEGGHLRIVQGDVADPACVDAVVSGASAVISLLGPSSNQPVFEVSRGMQQIIAAMHKHAVRRLIVSSGAGVAHPGDDPKLFDLFMHVLIKAISRNVYLDMLKTVDLVRSSQLDWTVVRVPMLTDAPENGEVKVGMVGKGLGPRLARADLAAYLLKQVESDAQLHQAPAISN